MYPRSVPYEHNPPRRENILTVAMPGVTSSRAQLSRYTGPEDGVLVLDNEADPLVAREDGARGARSRRSYWATIKYALWLLFHLREDERSHADSSCEANDSRSAAAAAAAASSSSSSSSFPFPSPLPAPPVIYHARCRIGCRLLHNVLPSPEVTEIVHRRWYGTLHGIHWLLVAKEVATCLWFSVRPIQWCYSEVGRTNIGGTMDQLAFMRDVQRAVELVQAREREARAALQHDEAREGDAPGDGGSIRRPRLRPHLVLFGCSRGATACFYAAMKLPRSLAAYVSLVVVEAPFDTLRSVIDSSSFFPSLNLWLFKAFCDHAGIEDEREAYSYDPDGVHLRCPVAFVLSTRDTRVPNSCTQRLIDDVRERLVPDKVPAVEVLTLRHSRHPCMAVGHKDDQAAYVGFMEALYDKYCSG